MRNIHSKATILIAATLFLVQTVCAQFSLTQQTHGLNTGDIHVTKSVEFADPGKSGENVIWDFSKLDCTGNKISNIIETTGLNDNTSLNKSNVAIESDNTIFFYTINQNELVYNGLTTNRSVVVFDTPIHRMKYPFTYGNSFESTFTGHGTYGGTSETFVNGDIHIEADGNGTIVLPNGILNNVLRVKTQSRIMEISECSFEETITTKYLWYAQNERYPVFALLHTVVKTPEKGAVVNKKGYYSDKVFASRNKSITASINNYLNMEHSYKVFPNPFAENLTVDVELAEKSHVEIDVFDMNGKYISSIANDKYPAHIQQKFNISGAGLKLSQGVYFVRLKLGNKTYLERVVYTP